MTRKLTVNEFYLEGLKSQKVLGLKCENGHYTTPPRDSCRICRSKNLEIVELKGLGSVASFTEIHAKSREFPISPPYKLALVRLDEGSNILGVFSKEHEISVGLPVRVKFVHFEGTWPRIMFEPA
jgi:uncharacterized OB-fold protein